MCIPFYIFIVTFFNLCFSKNNIYYASQIFKYLTNMLFLWNGMQIDGIY